MGNKCCKKGGAAGAGGHSCSHGQGSHLIQAIKDESEFSAVLKNPSNEGKIIVADFFASWCGPCQKIEPHFEKLAEDFTNAVFVKVNVDENEELALSNEVSSLPKFIIFKNGEKVDELQGDDEVKLRELVARHATPM